MRAAHLKDAIQRFLDAWNERNHPFAWVKSPAEVLRSCKREAISVSVH
jgi:hypothetical protein